MLSLSVASTITLLCLMQRKIKRFVLCHALLSFNYKRKWAYCLDRVRADQFSTNTMNEIFRWAVLHLLTFYTISTNSKVLWTILWIFRQNMKCITKYMRQHMKYRVHLLWVTKKCDFHNSPPPQCTASWCTIYRYAIMLTGYKLVVCCIVS